MALDLVSLPGNVTRTSYTNAVARYGRTYEFKAVLCSTPQHFPKQFAAMRVHGALFDIMIKLADQPIDFKSVDLAEDSLRVPIGELRGFAAYMREAFDNPVTFLEVAPDDGSLPLKLQLQHGTLGVSSDLEMMQGILEVLHSKLAALSLTSSLFRPANLFESLGQYSFFLQLDRTFDEPLEFDFDVDHSAKEDADAVIFSVASCQSGVRAASNGKVPRSCPSADAVPGSASPWLPSHAYRARRPVQ